MRQLDIQKRIGITDEVYLKRAIVTFSMDKHSLYLFKLVYLQVVGIEGLMLHDGLLIVGSKQTQTHFITILSLIYHVKRN